MSFEISAHENERRFIQISSENGLSHNHVKNIYQDHLGYMWFGTHNGLNRYDGHYFRIFTAGLHQDEGLIHPTINHITPKNDNEIWICTPLGVSIYNICKNSISSFPPLNNKSVETSCTDNNGNIWFGTQNGIYKYSFQKDTIIIYNKTEDPNSLSNDHVIKIFQDSYSNIWIGTYDGLNLYDPENDSFINYLSSRTPGYQSENEIRDIAEDNENRLWIAIPYSGTYQYSGIYQFNNYSDRPEKGKFTKIFEGSTNVLLVDDTLLWTGQGSGGCLTIIDLNSLSSPEGVQYTVHKQAPENLWKISGNSITSLYKDRNDDIWIGTYGEGVNLFSKRTKQFQSYGVTSTEGKSINNNYVTSFCDDGDYLWVGSGGGLDKLHKESGYTEHYYSGTGIPGQLVGEGVYAINKDKNNNLWVGTWNGGLNKFIPEKNEFKAFVPSNAPGSISSPHVFAIEEDEDNKLWVGTINGGLNRFDIETETFEVFTHDPDDPTSLLNNSVNDIFITSKGEVLLSCYSGFSILNKETLSFKNYTHIEHIPTSLRRGQTLTIFEDSNNNIWIGGDLGLNLFNMEEEKFTHYTTYHGLPDNTINAILEDDHKNLWLSTNKGIVKFINGANTPDQPNFQQYNQNDGLPSDDFNVNSAIKGEDGVMNFGSSSGMVRFNPDHIHDNNIVPEIIITDFTIFGNQKDNDPEVLQTTNINLIDEIKLNYRQNNFVISYSAISYLNPGKNKYKYKLIGYDQQWYDAGNFRFATYTNLRPGNYTFVVTGTNNDGIWSDTEKELKITIVPPWWQTAAFQLSMIVLLLFLTYLLIESQFKIIKKRNQELELHIESRTRELIETNALLEESQEEIIFKNYELEKHQNELEELVNERTIQLQKAKEQAEQSDQLKTAFMANLSHELRTPMNAIVGFSNLLTQDTLEEANKKTYVNIINSNSNTNTLLTLINDIMDISLIETNQFNLLNQWFLVDEILQELYSLHTLDNERNLEIKVLQDPLSQNVKLYNDPVRIKQILSNLITNAIKYTKEGYVHFGTKVKNNQITFYVKDSGIGIPKEEIPKIFKSFYKVEQPNKAIYSGTGLGLSLCKRILDQMEVELYVESEPGKGAKFYFSLPLNNEQ